MNNGGERHLARGIVAGVAAGLVASWVMNVFMENAGPKLQQAMQTPEENAQAEGEQTADSEPKEGATMKAADAVVSAVTAGRHLSFEEKQKGGSVVHYAFGAIMGGLYGAMAEYSDSITAVFGMGFGGALFTGADLFAVPALNLSESSSEQSLSALASPFAAHLVYGATTEMVRRLVRSMLEA